MPNLCQGRLVWVEITGLDGQTKRRPVVITTADADIAAARELDGIACSHSAAFRSPRPADYIEIPFHPAGRCRSKLTKPTIAICSWTVTIRKHDIEALPDRYVGGVISPKLVRRIIEAGKTLPREEDERG